MHLFLLHLGQNFSLVQWAFIQHGGVGVVQYRVVELQLGFCDLNVLFKLNDLSIDPRMRLDGCFGFDVCCLLLLCHLIEQGLETLALFLQRGVVVVALSDDPSGLVQIGCLVGQFIYHLVDVEIADRHVLEIREGGFFLSVGSTVVVGWWSLVFNGTRNASVGTRSLLGAWVRAWFSLHRSR